MYWSFEPLTDATLPELRFSYNNITSIDYLDSSFSNYTSLRIQSVLKSDHSGQNDSSR